MHQLPQSTIYLTRTNTLRISTCEIEGKYCTLEVQDGLNIWCVALMLKTHEICRKSLSVLLLRINLHESWESWRPIDWYSWWKCWYSLYCSKLRFTVIIFKAPQNKKITFYLWFNFKHRESKLLEISDKTQ